jgi:YVTN family beta-propeller protein/autotransporter-associated beta strand protein
MILDRLPSGKCQSCLLDVRSQIFCANGLYVCANGSIVQRAHRQGHSKIRLFLLATVCLAGATLCDLDVAKAQSGPLLYVPNAGDNNVSVIDTSTNASVPPPIVTGVQPVVVGVRGDQSLAYVTNMSSNTVSVINTATNLVVATVNVGSSPAGLAVNPTGTQVYIGNTSDGTISVINTATNSVVTTIVVGIIGSAAIAFTPDGTRAYVANMASNNVSVINAATNTVIGSPIPVGNNPFGLSVSPDGTRVYVVNNASDTVSVIDTATNTVVSTFAVGSHPRGVAVNPNGTRAFVANRDSNSVSVIDTATNTVVATISVGANPFGVSFSPDGTRAYVTNQTSNDVAIIDTANNTVISTVSVGQSPVFPGICSNGNALLAAGLTFKAQTSGALACTLASGPSGSTGPVFTGGTMQFAGSNITSALPISLQAAGGTFDTNGNNASLSGAISGPGSLTKIGAGTLTLAGASTYAGATSINLGTLQAGAANVFSPVSAFTVAGGATLDLNNFNQNIGSLAGAGSVTLGSAILTTGNDNTSTIFSGSIAGPGGMTKIGAGTLALTGTNTYSGATTVNAGTLFVNGSIANSAVTVNSGATLAGIGTVGATTINSGGIFAPGTSPGTMTVQGNLAFQSGALYLVQANPSTASSTNVTAAGSAALAGTVQAAFAAGSYASRTYTIVSAAGGLGGTTFNTLTTTNLPAGFTASLSYTATDAILNLTATLGQPSAPGGPSGPNALGTGGLSINQGNVANSLNTFFNNGGTLPPNFVTLFGLTGGNLANALSQLSGEAATGAQKVGFQLTDQFLNLMLDPFVDGRSGIGGADHPALGFAPEREPLPEDIALAYAKVLKAPPKPPSFEQRWSVWGAGYGGSNRTDGDPVVVGSHDLSARTAGGVAGLDYHFSPGRVVGFALAGGGTDWSLSQGLGGGKSDAFQAGLYAATRSGPAYVAAAFAFANHWMSTDRFAFAGDHLTADFNAQSYGGRLEGGYRFGTIYGGITPYAAIQAQSFRTPSYSEVDVNNGGFALAFNGRTATDTRSELGGRFDRVLAVYSNAVLALRGRLAWAHDWVSDPTLAAVFQTLPGASFIVNGALPVKDAALASAGGELRIANGITLLAKFDGEFASHSSTYAGTGTVRYRW